jgi:hypothetical protein
VSRSSFTRETAYFGRGVPRTVASPLNFAENWQFETHRARERLRAEHVEAGKIRDFDKLWPCIVPDVDAASSDALAKALDSTPGAARVALHRFRRRFGKTLRAEIASTVDDAEQVESELRFLLEVLAGRNNRSVR